MMYLTVLVISNPVISCNNRGESVGNKQTLQQITTPTGVRTVLSGAAIKRAMRDSMIARGAVMWRLNDPDNHATNPAGYTYGANKSPTMAGAEPSTPADYADAQFGYMRAEKDKVGSVAKKKGVCEVSMALSTTNYEGDVAFNQGLKSSEPLLNPYTSERHFTRYQYTVTWDLAKVNWTSFHAAARSLLCLAVGGSHSSNAMEITPAVLLYALHTAPGRAGLQVGVGDIFPPDVPVDATKLSERATAIGAAYEGVCVQDNPAQGIVAMTMAAARFCGGA